MGLRAKITHKLIAGIEPASKAFDVRDTTLTGFIARVRPSGSISYLVQYRDTAGAQQSYTIGQHGKDGLNPTTARDKAEQVRFDARQGKDPHQERKAKTNAHKLERSNTLEAYLSGEYQDKLMTRKPHSAGEAERMIRRNFSNWLNEPLTHITVERVNQWRKAQRKPRIVNGKKRAPLADATIVRINAELNSMVVHAVEDGYLAANPLARLKPIKSPDLNNVKPRYLSTDERQRLFIALAERQTRFDERARSPKGFRFCNHLEPMIILSLNTGMRQGEVFALQWEDINDDFTELEVRAEIAKSGKARTIALNANAREALESWRRQSNSTEYVFDNGGEPLTTVKKAWRLLLKSAKVENFRWHDMRHDFASQLVIRGVPLNTVRELLGHADLKTTLRYAHLSDTAKSDAVTLLVDC